MLKYESLCKTYPGDIKAVVDLNLEVAKGSVFVLLGANGAGKTTTIMMTLGFVEPTSGFVFVNDVNVQKNPIEAKRHMAFVSENVILYGNFNALQNIRFFCKLGGAAPSDEEIHAALDLVDLARPARTRRVKTYSKGMRQRAGLALAILKKTPLIVMDEPMSGLDPKGARDMLGTFLRLRDEGRTIFMTTHDIFRAKQMADVVGIMNSGRLAQTIARDDFDAIDLEEVYLEAVSTEQKCF